MSILIDWEKAKDKKLSTGELKLQPKHNRAVGSMELFCNHSNNR